MEKAKENNNRLTQTINEKGELVSIENMNTQEKNLGVNATMEDIKNEMFEGDNIVMDKNTDHGLKDVLDNMEKANEQKKSNDEDEGEDDLNKQD